MYWRNNFFNVKKGVFVPENETEELIDLINNYKTGIEVGTGTGVISISLSLKKIKMVAIDISTKSIKLAKLNAKKNNTVVDFKREDIFKYVPDTKFDFLVSNPPYISVGDPLVENWVKKNQPYKALYAKKNGLEFYEFLISNRKKFVKPGGKLFFEIGWNQKNELEKKILKSLKYNFISDINNYYRYLIIEV